MAGGTVSAVVTFLVQAIIYLIQRLRNTSFVNPEWVENIMPLISKIPIIGGILAALPVDALAWILSFIVLWIVFYTIFANLKGSLGYIVAFLVGVFIIYIWIGGHVSVNIPRPGG